MTDRFITEADYVMIGDEALKVLQQSDERRRERAEQSAQEEISGYLRGRYDTEAVFAARGDDRNSKIVTYYCDLALLELAGSLPGRMGLELREKRYKLAIEWLDKVQAGKVIPALPTLTGPAGEKDINNPVRYGSGQKNSYDW